MVHPSSNIGTRKGPLDTIKEESMEERTSESVEKGIVKKEPVTTSKSVAAQPLSSKPEDNLPSEHEVEPKPVSGLPSSSRVVPQGNMPPYVSSPKSGSSVSSPTPGSSVSSPRLHIHQTPQQPSTRLPQSPISQTSPSSPVSGSRSPVSRPISRPTPQPPSQTATQPVTSVPKPQSPSVRRSLPKASSQPVTQSSSQPVSQQTAAVTEDELKAKYQKMPYMWLKNECLSRGLPASGVFNQLVNQLVNDDLKKSSGSTRTTPLSPSPASTSPVPSHGSPSVSPHVPSSPRTVPASSPHIVPASSVHASSPRISSSSPAARVQEAEESRLQKLREEEEKRKQQLKTQTHPRTASPLRMPSPSSHPTSPTMQDRMRAFQKSTQTPSRVPDTHLNLPTAPVLPSPVSRPVAPATNESPTPALPPKLETPQSPRALATPASQQRPASPRLPAAATQPTTVPDES